MGIAGWRLDVADELPDAFIDNLTRAAKSVNPEALVLGEVWEDASNKTGLRLQTAVSSGRSAGQRYQLSFQKRRNRFRKYRRRKGS